MSKIASLLSESQSISLPSTLEVNPIKEGKYQCYAIFLRSGKEIEDPKKGVVVT